MIYAETPRSEKPYEWSCSIFANLFKGRFSFCILFALYLLTASLVCRYTSSQPRPQTVLESSLVNCKMVSCISVSYFSHLNIASDHLFAQSWQGETEK